MTKINKIRFFVVATVCGIIILVISALPLRANWSARFVERGDGYLADKKYLSAIVEYKKAKALKNDQTVLDRLDLAQSAENDVFVLLQFYRQQNNTAQLNLFNRANAVPDSSYNLISLAKTLIEQNEPQLAIVATKTAIEMDKDYRDAWLYNGIANIKVAQLAEIRSDVAEKYLSDAKTSLTRAHEIDPTYEPTQQYLNQLWKQFPKN